MITFLSRVISFYRSGSKISDERVFAKYRWLQYILLLHFCSNRYFYWKLITFKFKYLELVSYIDAKGNYVHTSYFPKNRELDNKYQKEDYIIVSTKREKYIIEWPSDTLCFVSHLLYAVSATWRLNLKVGFRSLGWFNAPVSFLRFEETEERLQLEAV